MDSPCYQALTGNTTASRGLHRHKVLRKYTNEVHFNQLKRDVHKFELHWLLLYVQTGFRPKRHLDSCEISLDQPENGTLLRINLDDVTRGSNHHKHMFWQIEPASWSFHVSCPLFQSCISCTGALNNGCHGKGCWGKSRTQPQHIQVPLLKSWHPPRRLMKCSGITPRRRSSFFCVQFCSVCTRLCSTGTDHCIQGDQGCFDT